MTYKFDDGISFKDKIKLFFDGISSSAHRFMLVLALMLALSIFASVAFKRIPFVTLLFSVPPLILSVDMVRSEYIEDYPMMYISLCSLSVISGVVECLLMDRRDGGHRAAFAGDVVALLAAGGLMFVWRSAETLPSVDGTDIFELNAFDYEIYKNAGDTDMKIFAVLTCVYVCLALLSFILRDVYFIDAVLAVPPCVAAIYLWNAGRIAAHPEIAVTFAVVYLGVRLIPAVLGKASVRTADNT